MSLFTIVGAILAVGFIIMVHEAGHYIVARWCKMRVDRFSIGFGPPILKKKHGETDFTIGPIPFGGFVQIHGMLISEEGDEDDPRSYPNRPVWQRFATIFAGPATNYIAAFFLAILFFNLEGVPLETARVVVDGVDEGFDAVGKLEAGDIISKVNGELVYAVKDRKRPKKGFVQRVQESEGTPLELTIIRDGKELVVSVSAKLNPSYIEPETEPEPKAENEERAEGDSEPAPPPVSSIPKYRIGIVLTYERGDIGIVGAIGHAAKYPFVQTRDLVSGLYMLATNKEARKGATVGSVVMITDELKKSIERGLAQFLSLMMLLNVYIGLFNLFPLPALDGGRLVFLVYEMVTRRRANPKIEATVHMVGIVALILLLIVVTYKDIQRLVF